MVTSTKQRRLVKPVAPILRQVILLRPLTGNTPGLLQVTASGTTSRYTVRRMASGIGGRAFELAKQGEDPGDRGPPYRAPRPPADVPWRPTLPAFPRGDAMSLNT